MKIALIGYGKMGKMIEHMALQKGHEIVLKIDKDDAHLFTKQNVAKADVAIEFTTPHTAYDNVKKLLEFGVPVVCGSTGWNDKLEEIKTFSKAHAGSFLHASNFSIGVNIFFELNKRLAQLMAPHAAYDVVMEETHHTQKLDKPSGTAVTLAEGIIQNLPRKQSWTIEKVENKEQIFIDCQRIDPAPGTHSVKYTSVVDEIEIIHTAHSREGFAAGAVLAAEYIHDKKGVFTMKDVLGL